ncbi:MAG: periplasmic heavy metal sensor [Hyphomicrobiales bacterium]
MVETPERASADAPRRSRWWLALLVLSLALNLVVLGAVAVRLWAPERFERFTGSGYSPLLPRKFLSDLSSEKRKEVGDLLRRNRAEFRSDFAAMRKAAADLADALERQPYDEAAVTAAIANHVKTIDRMVDRGAAVTMDVVRKLTPDERSLLAKRIRERVDRRR